MAWPAALSQAGNITTYEAPLGYAYETPLGYVYEAPLYKCPFLELFPVELLDKVPCMKSLVGTLSANSLSHRLRGYTHLYSLGPMLHWFFLVANFCHLFFRNFFVYFTFFLSLENETGADFQTQPSQSTRQLSLNVASNFNV